MNKIKIFFGFLLVISVAACTDWVDPSIPYSDFETGTYLRTLARTADVNFFNLDNAKFSVTVEAVDAEDGKTVREVEVFVKRRRGNSLSPEAKVATVPASAFQPHSIILRDIHPASGSKYPAATIEITIPQALQAMNMTKADINGGDFFEFRLSLTTTSGRVFSSENLSGDVQGGQYYASPFFYRVPVVCPSSLQGEYVATTTGTSTDPCCPGSTTVTGTIVTLTKTAPGAASYNISDWSAGLYVEWYGVPYNLPATHPRLVGVITDACGVISGSFDEPFQTRVTVTGSVNPATGVITYTWKNGYDDEATVVLTPK
ncbi:MAG TPA: hypothetical protein PKD70_09170 [Saprospiraceae bacterium]|nr:hypothetical protein [Saprospiraceae bacterium]HMP14041.1 hypothetical protein [Saprospiraceae bacterium]